MTSSSKKSYSNSFSLHIKADTEMICQLLNNAKLICLFNVCGKRNFSSKRCHKNEMINSNSKEREASILFYKKKRMFHTIV